MDTAEKSGPAWTNETTGTVVESITLPGSNVTNLFIDEGTQTRRVSVEESLLSDGGKKTVLIQLRSLSEPAPDQTLSVEQLQTHASRTQRDAMDLIESSPSIEQINSLWLGNTIVAEVNTSAVDLRHVASMKHVTGIYKNRKWTIQSRPANATHSPPNASQASETQAFSEEYTYGLEQIRADYLQEEFGLDGTGVDVAVLDTGVDEDHRDITVSQWQEFDRNGGQISSTPQDYDPGGHGTHTSGTVVGHGETFYGQRFGVAPDANLLHGAVLTYDCSNDCSGYTSQVTAGIQWAVNNDAEVVSMSLGPESDGHNTNNAYVNPIRDAQASGAVVVAAIGNDGEGTSNTPGNGYDSLGVGATTEQETVWDSSGGGSIDAQGDWCWPSVCLGNPPSDWPAQYTVPSVSAPGSAVTSAEAGGGYTAMSGTSMATPHVAGAAALLVEYDYNDQLSPDEIHTLLENTARKPAGEPSDQDDRYGHGIIDPYQAAITEFIDTEVTDVSYPSGEYAAGDTVETTVEVTNNGQRFHSSYVSYDMLGPDGVPTSASGAVVSVSPGETKTVTLSWTVPSDATTGSYDIGVTTWAESDSSRLLNTLDSASADDVFTVPPDKLDVSIDSYDEVLPVGETVDVQATMTNVGGLERTDELEFSFDGSTKCSLLSSPEPGESFTTDCSYTLQSNDLPSIPITVSTDDDSEQRTVTVLKPATFDVTITGTNAPIDEGEDLTVTADIQNTGDLSGSKTVDLDVESLGSDSRSVSLAGGETKTRTFTVSTAIGDADSYTATVSSPDDTDSTGVTVDEVPTPAFDTSGLTVEPNPAEVGQAVTTSITVENTGDASGSTTLNLVVGGESVDSRSVSLGAGESTTVTFADVSRSDPDDYTVEVDGPAVSRKSTTLTVEGVEFGAQSLSVAPNPAAPDESVTTSVVVENTGNIDGTTSVSLRVDGTAVDSKTVSVGAGGSKTVTFAEFSRSTPGDYSLTVDGPDISTKSTTLTVDGPAFGLRELSVEPNPADPGESVTTSVVVENTGTQTGSTTLTLTAGLTTVSSTTVDVGAGETTTVTFPAFSKAEPDVYEVTVNGADVDESSTSLTVGSPSFSLSDPMLDPNPVSPGEPVTATATLWNNANIAGSTTLTLTVDGTVVDSRSVDIWANTGETVQFDEFTRSDPGTYSVVIDGPDVDARRMTLEVTNSPPVADADVPWTVPTETAVTLDASASADPEGASLSYDWRQTAGPTVSVTDASTATPEFTAPVVNSSAELRFEVTVTDKTGATDAETVRLVVTDDTPMSRLWTVDTGSRMQYSEPALSEELAIMAGLDETVTAVDRYNGSVAWTFDRAGSLVDSSPAVHDGRVYVGSGSGTIYALSATDGTVAWTTATDSAVVSSPTVADGYVFVGSNDGTILALNASDGTVEWTHDAPAPVYSSPAVAKSTVYVTTTDGHVVALDAATGDSGTVETGGELGRSSPVVTDDHLFVAGDALYALDPADGSELWSSRYGGTAGSTPTVADGRLYVGSADGTVSAWNVTTGTAAWTTPVGAPVGSSPTVVGDTLVVGTDDGSVVVLNRTTGAVLTTTTIADRRVRSSPVVLDGVAVLGNSQGSVVALANVPNATHESTGIDQGQVDDEAEKILIPEQLD